MKYGRTHEDEVFDQRLKEMIDALEYMDEEEMDLEDQQEYLEEYHKLARRRSFIPEL